MKKSLRLVVVEQNGHGGLIHYAYQMCTALAEAGHDVTLLTACDYELHTFPHNFKVARLLKLWPLVDHRLEAPPRNVFEKIWNDLFWQARRALRALKLILAWCRLTTYLLQQKPDLVQFSKINFSFEALFLAVLRKRGLILTQICHEFERRESQNPFTRLLDRVDSGIYHNFAALFFHAKENLERFHTLFDIPRTRTHLIPHGNESLFLTHAAQTDAGTDLRHRYGLAADDNVVLFFGILAPSKGLAVLIDAFAHVIQQLPAKLIVAGHPSKFIPVAEYHQQVAALDLSSAVLFDSRYIPIHEVGALMALANVVVFPYLNSTQSGSLQVAYAFGRPIIASAVGGLQEAVEDGKSGYLVPPANPLILAEKIIALLSDSEQAARMGAYGQHLSETRYSWKGVSDIISSVYTELVPPIQHS